MEVWRDIKGYEGRYQVSSEGRVKTVNRFKSDFRRQREGIRKTQIDHHGYEFVNLFDGHRFHRHSVHVLVARAFIDNPEDKNQVNHIDGDKLNNRLENLEWCTASENQIHALKMGLVRTRRGEDNKCTRISDAEAREMITMRRSGAKLQDIADAFGVSFGYVGRIVRGDRRTYLQRDVG